MMVVNVTRMNGIMPVEIDNFLLGSEPSVDVCLILLVVFLTSVFVESHGDASVIILSHANLIVVKAVTRCGRKR